MKLCIDCQFYGGHVGLAEICKHHLNRRPDYVYGGVKPMDASWLRNLKEPDKCGPDGKWWTKRTDKSVVIDIEGKDK